MIERSFDADTINALVNHPAIRPHVGGDPSQPIDLTGAVANTDHYFLLGEHGGFACTWTAPKTYEIHTFVRPEGRGKWAYQLARAGRDYMQAAGATHLWTRVHESASNVKRFTLAAGFEPAGSQVVDFGIGPETYELFDWRSECQQS